MAQKDIKDFTLLASSEDTDNVLLVRNDDTAAKIPVGTLKSEFASTISSESGTSDSARGVETRIIKDSGTAFAAATNSDSVSTGNGVTLTETIGTITDLLRGDSATAYARNNAYVNLGGYSSWSDANAALDALMLDNTTHKYDGRLKFDVQGANNEVVMFIRRWGDVPVWVQRVSGAITLSDGALASGSTYAEYTRYTDANTGVVSDWVAYPDLSSYATNSALSNVLATALGAGSETAFNSAIKREELTSEQLNSRLDTLITDRRSNETNGMYVLHHSYGHTAILIMGGNCQSDTPTSSQFRMQYIIGNITKISNSDTSLGFTKGCAWSTLAIDVLARQIRYTGNGTEYEVTSQWTSWYDYNAVTSSGATDLSDVAMRPLYIEGNGISNAVVYNSTTGYYELNGLTDITPEQMRLIYNYTHVTPCASACSPAPIRTSLPWHVYKVQYSAVGTNDLDLSKMFRSCSQLEVCVLTTSSYFASPANASNMFNGCSYLRSVSAISLERINSASNFTAMFKGCSKLESVLIRKLRISGFSLSDSPNITAASISYLIANASNTSAITVTVNQNVLDSINHGEGDWTGIADAAATQQISFVS